MAKKLIIGTVSVWVVWFIMDFIIHGNLLMPLYDQTASLWRPQAEMKMGLGIAVGLICAGAFSAVYVLMISPKSMQAALKYAGLIGITWGVGFGLGNYSYMPVPLSLAAYWFLAIFIESLAAGAILGFLVKDD